MRSIARSSNSFKSEEWTTYVDTWMVSRNLSEAAILPLLLNNLGRFAPRLGPGSRQIQRLNFVVLPFLLGNSFLLSPDILLFRFRTKGH